MLLARLGIEPQLYAADICERSRPGELPNATALRLSQEKLAVARRHCRASALILAADTVVALEIAKGWQTFGKPQNAAEARDMLLSLAGREHRVHTGFALASGEILLSQVVTSHVKLRRMQHKDLRKYLVGDTPYDKAGGYAIQDSVFRPVEQIRGSYSNVMGLPLEALVFALQRFNFSIPFLNTDVT